VKRRQESEPALISVIVSFLLPLSEVKYHWPKTRKGEKTVKSIMFDEERLDPHGVGNLLHALTIKNKLSTCGSQRKS